MHNKDKIYIQSLTDQEIVKGILDRDNRITRLYIYEKYYPLFNSLFNGYYTDCESCLEFINKVYVYLLTPNQSTGKCYLSTFGFGCSLGSWLKIVATNYCHQLHRKKVVTVSIDDTGQDSEEITGGIDRLPIEPTPLNTESIDKEDAATVLHLMRNPNYRELIRCRYVEEMSNTETAKILGMTMKNYYNAHKRAKAQFVEVLRKEGLL